MKLQLVAPRRGFVWVKRAFQVCARQPLGFAALFATCMFVFLLLRMFPVVGTTALLALAPAGALLFMIASHRVVEGKTAMPGSIAELATSGRPQFAALAKLGVAYAAAVMVLFWVAGLLDGGAFASFVVSLATERASAEATAARIADPRLQLGVILRMTFAAALSIPFWHAPALVHWGRHHWAKSLFFSTVGIWRNKGAFTIYGLTWFAISMVLTPVFSVAEGLLAPEQFALVAMPVVLACMTLYCASFWFTFADCFSPDDAAPLRDTVDSTDPFHR